MLIKMKTRIQEYISMTSLVLDLIGLQNKGIAIIAFALFRKRLDHGVASSVGHLSEEVSYAAVEVPWRHSVVLERRSAGTSDSAMEQTSWQARPTTRCRNI